ncbi:MAG: tetratricopeptide repeat protein [Bacteroidales bacterium]
MRNSISILKTVVMTFSMFTLFIFSVKAQTDTTEVIKLMQEGIKKVSDNELNRAIYLFDQGREKLFKIAISIDERNENIIESNKITREAERLIKQENLEGALDLLNQAIELNDQNVEAYKFRGSIRLILEQQKPRKRDRDYIKLINDYTNAISIVNKNIDNTDRRSQERHEFEKEKAKILINRAYVKMQSNRTPGFYSAIDDYNEATQLDSENWDAYLGRAVAYNKLREYRREVNDYLKAIELMQKYDYFLTDEEWSNLYLNVANAYANLRDKRNAFDYAVKSYNLGNLEAEKLMEKNRP